MKAQKNTKIMVTCALLVALQVILARFLSINTTFASPSWPSPCPASFSAPCGLWPWAR